MSDRITSCREAHLLVIDILLLLFFTTASPTVGQGQTLRGLQTVSPTHKLEKRLKGGETHSYQITLKAGDYFHVGVEQRAIDVVLLVTGPDGRNVCRARQAERNGWAGVSVFHSSGTGRVSSGCKVSGREGRSRKL